VALLSLSIICVPLAMFDAVLSAMPSSCKTILIYSLKSLLLYIVEIP